MCEKYRDISSFGFHVFVFGLVTFVFYRIQQCVKFVLVKFEIRVISVCGYTVLVFDFGQEMGD